MSYRASLHGNQYLTVSNQGKQTLITLISSSPGQQQSQSNSLTTGEWTTPPQLFYLDSSFILQINSDRGKHFVLIQANSISTTVVPVLDNAVPINLEETTDSTANQNSSDFEPMQPMQPMKMGNMSMNMNPMSMQMGNMSMTMGKQIKSPQTKRFCTQCGQEAKIGDRFCGNCGHQLKV